jgi:hypothetical protein
MSEKFTTEPSQDKLVQDPDKAYAEALAEASYREKAAELSQETQDGVIVAHAQEAIDTQLRKGEAAGDIAGEKYDIEQGFDAVLDSLDVDKAIDVLNCVKILREAGLSEELQKQAIKELTDKYVGNDIIGRMRGPVVEPERVY